MKQVIHLVRNLLFLILLFIIPYSYAMFQGGFVSWFLFFSIFPIFLYLLGFTFYPIRKWKVSRTLSSKMIQSGNTLEVNIHIKRFMPFPLFYCEIEEDFPTTLQKVDHKVDKYIYLNNPSKVTKARQMKRTIFPMFKRNITCKYELENVPRGKHNLRTVRIYTGDIFGFIKKEHSFQIDHKFLVYPNEWKIHFKNQLSSMEHGAKASTMWKNSTTNVVSTIREYVPGDKYSWIDWKQTANKNTLMSKEFEREKDYETLLVLDCCAYEGMNLLAFEGAVELTNSLVSAFENESLENHLLFIHDQVKYFTYYHDQKEKKNVKRYLAKVQPGAKYEFTTQFNKVAINLRRQSSLIIITTQISPELVEQLHKLKFNVKNVQVYLVNSRSYVTMTVNELTFKLQSYGISVHFFTEENLKNNILEVSV